MHVFRLQVNTVPVLRGITARLRQPCSGLKIVDSDAGTRLAKINTKHPECVTAGDHTAVKEFSLRSF